jgi:hypothetical protein
MVLDDLAEGPAEKWYFYAVPAADAAYDLDIAA